MKTLKKFRNTQRVPSVLGKRFKNENITCWATWERLVKRNLLREKLDIAQYFQTSASSLVERNLRRSKIRIVLKTVIGGYILKQFNIRQKMIILNSLTVPKN